MSGSFNLLYDEGIIPSWTIKLTMAGLDDQGAAEYLPIVNFNVKGGDVDSRSLQRFPGELNSIMLIADGSIDAEFTSQFLIEVLSGLWVFVTHTQGELDWSFRLPPVQMPTGAAEQFVDCSLELLELAKSEWEQQ